MLFRSEATRKIVSEARLAMAGTRAGLKFLGRQQHPLVPLNEIAAYQQLMNELAAILTIAPPQLLKRAYDLRKQSLVVREAVDRLATDYCALLRAAEHRIVHHGRTISKMRSEAVLTRHVRRRMRHWPAVLGRRLEPTIAAMLTQVQHVLLRREFRRNLARAARNRELLRQRLARIEQRFGLRSGDLHVGAVRAPSRGAMRLVPAE